MRERCFLGDSCVLYSWGTEISLEGSRRVLQAYRAVKSDPVLSRSGLLDAVPAYTSLAVYFDPVEADIGGLLKRTEALLGRVEGHAPPDSSAPELLRIPVVYDGADLDRVASHTGLSVSEVIRRHAHPRYTVAMIGFLPHFPYLIGMDELLATPRLPDPRRRVPAGSVAIGGAQTGIYPSVSPGGWNLVGRTDPELLPGLRPGDAVVFEEVDTL
jgi:KipI family sensor histidine kinase inhibitor